MRFFNAKVQDGGLQAGKELRFDAIGIVERWGAEGWQWVGADAPVHLLGVDPYVLMPMRV